MDPERWPQVVREFIDHLGSKHSGVRVDVAYDDPLWCVTATCPCCKTTVFWALSGPPPLDGIPEPGWYALLANLPPGG